MDELNNIWNADDELNEEQLMKYIQGKLTEQETNAFERKMADSAFLNDGVEGLQQFSSSEKINAYVQQTNSNLHQRITGKKIKKNISIQNISWELAIAIIVILLCILGYAII